MKVFSSKKDGRQIDAMLHTATSSLDVNSNIITISSVAAVILIAGIIFFVVFSKKKVKPAINKPVDMAPQLAYINPQLLNYVKSVLNMGYTYDQIKQNLLYYGYREEEINLCFSQIQRGA